MRFVVYRSMYFGSVRRDIPDRFFWLRGNAHAYVWNEVPDASLVNPVGRHAWVIVDRWSGEEVEVFRW